MESVDIGVRIASWRKAKGLTRLEIAEALGVSVAAVYQWEGSGGSKTTPSLTNLEKLVARLGLTMERFYGTLPKARKSA